MRSYRQLTSEERYALSALRRQGYSIRAAARALERAPSTISREIRRNVDRKTGFTLVGKLDSRTVGDTNRRAIELIRRTDRRVRTITADHGTEFHGYRDIEAATGARFYFATPYRSWERGTSENTNGLRRQYFPKRASLATVTQKDCARVARQLNRRPRKKLDFRTPVECYEKS